ncbi:MAG: PHP domain-containing protein [Candidatus Micrarchaeota archaeon]|nr:PHP domain-containing protein [Candidatus Micrarchaeota archaeon]
MLKCDFHIHTYRSPDSNIKPPDLIKTAVEKGLDVIGVVDHDVLWGGLEASKIARDIAPDLTVIPGEEIKTGDGEIIALNIKKTIKSGLGIEMTAQEVKKQGGFLIVPHPFDKMRRGVLDNISLIKNSIDAIEVFNARSIFSSFNAKARAYATENMIPMVAGSDAHFLYEIGAAYTMIDSDNDMKSIFDAIAAGRTKIEGKRTGMKPHLGTFFQKRFGKNPGF